MSKQVWKNSASIASQHLSQGHCKNAVNPGNPSKKNTENSSLGTVRTCPDITMGDGHQFNTTRFIFQMLKWIYGIFTSIYPTQLHVGK